MPSELLNGYVRDCKKSCSNLTKIINMCIIFPVLWKGLLDMPTLEDAVPLAARMHEGQLDKARVTYLLHPLHVMLNPSLETDEERMAAVLHDVV